MIDFANLETIAASLYDCDWRAEDRDLLISEYDFEAKEADVVCEFLARFEAKAKAEADEED